MELLVAKNRTLALMFDASVQKKSFIRQALGLGDGYE